MNLTRHTASTGGNHTASPMRQIKRHHTEKSSGQSFVELTLAIPLILILLAGIVEVTFLIFTYLNLLDLTREAARFASARDYNIVRDESSCEGSLDYYYHTACFFIDGTLNPYIPLSEDNMDDVTISVFVVTNDTISDRHPTDQGGVWSLFNNNWQKDCEGNTVTSEPTFTNAEIQSKFVGGAPGDRGLVLVEAYMCYDLVLNLPIISDITPSPFRLHAYTLMPAPEALPTPTPIGP